MSHAEKERKIESNLSRLIKGMGLSLGEFAREIGVSASAIKKAAEGKRDMSQELRVKIFAETGVLFDKNAPNEILVYSKEDHRMHKEETTFNEKGAAIASGLVAKQIELLMLAASRPTVRKTLPIFTALNIALAKIKNEYHLEKHIDALLRERNATQTQLYTVKELRDNDVLSKQVGFKDDPKLKDEDKIPLAKTIGWLPAKDCFNIVWQNREFMKALLNSDSESLTDEQKNQLAAMEAQMDKEIDAFLPVELRGNGV